jgi:multiple sugar transport system substrate-binding protein
VFKDPPENLTPTLDTPQAIQAAEFYGNILRTYAPEGVLSYTDDQMVTAQVQGRANISMHSLPVEISLADPKKSKVYDKVAYVMVPAGPTGLFPGRKRRLGSSSSGRSPRRPSGGWSRSGITPRPAAPRS